MTFAETTSDQNHIFDRSGIAALSDLRSARCSELTGRLEKDQQAFLDHATEFRSLEYALPDDPLHTWSRIWEYPYIYHHMEALYSRLPASPAPHAVDLGSGVTFFPFSVARLGWHVTCADIDPVCEKDLGRAAQVVDCRPGRVGFRLINSPSLPFLDREVDTVYCISVIEHIDRFEDAVEEIARILKPEGVLLLTFDLDLRGDRQLGTAAYARLMAKIRDHFVWVYPETTPHPADMLHSSNGPYGFKEPQGRPRMKYFLKQEVIKPLLRRRPRPMFPYSLTVMGHILKKRSSG